MHVHVVFGCSETYVSQKVGLEVLRLGFDNSLVMIGVTYETVEGRWLNLNIIARFVRTTHCLGQGSSG
jgi:hypothetical protein